METALSKERKQWRKREAEIQQALKERDIEIETADAKLRKWDSRKDVINHYMGIVGSMAKFVSPVRWQDGLFADLPQGHY